MFFCFFFKNSEFDEQNPLAATSGQTFNVGLMEKELLDILARSLNFECVSLLTGLSNNVDLSWMCFPGQQVWSEPTQRLLRSGHQRERFVDGRHWPIVAWGKEKFEISFDEFNRFAAWFHWQEADLSVSIGEMTPNLNRILDGTITVLYDEIKILTSFPETTVSGSSALIQIFSTRVSLSYTVHRGHLWPKSSLSELIQETFKSKKQLFIVNLSFGKRIRSKQVHTWNKVCSLRQPLD